MVGDAIVLNTESEVEREAMLLYESRDGLDFVLKGLKGV